ncbi:MAG: PqqD family protein [Candidatus Auribacterota bacterium]|nr:PqqD family protein [Candidatus Auribacterota bacterium]
MNEEDLNRIYQKNPDVVYRVIAGEAILLPISKETQVAGRLFSLNEVGAFIWERIDGKYALRDIVKDITGEYEVSEENVRGDLINLIGKLEELKAIKIVSVDGPAIPVDCH